MTETSSATGVIIFRHEDNVDPSYIDQFVDFTHKHFTYGALMMNPMGLDDNDTNRQWGKAYTFETFGHWNAYSAFERYFESFNEFDKEPFMDQFDGFEMELAYIDVEPSTKLLEQVAIEIRPVIDSDSGRITTDFVEQHFHKYEFNTRNIMELSDLEAVFDTFTKEGIENFISYITAFYEEMLPPVYKHDCPRLYNLVSHIARNDALTPSLLLSVFKDKGVRQVYADMDYLDFFDEHRDIKLFIETNVIDHPKLEPFVKESYHESKIL